MGSKTERSARTMLGRYGQFRTVKSRKPAYPFRDVRANLASKRAMTLTGQSSGSALLRHGGSADRELHAHLARLALGTPTGWNREDVSDCAKLLRDRLIRRSRCEDRAERLDGHGVMRRKVHRFRDALSGRLGNVVEGVEIGHVGVVLSLRRVLRDGHRLRLVLRTIAAGLAGVEIAHERLGTVEARLDRVVSELRGVVPQVHVAFVPRSDEGKQDGERAENLRSLLVILRLFGALSLGELDTRRRRELARLGGVVRRRLIHVCHCLDSF